MAFRVIGAAANCIEKSLGMKFSMENLEMSMQDDELDEPLAADTADNVSVNADSVPVSDVSACSHVSDSASAATTCATADSSQTRRSKRLKRSRVVQAMECPLSSDFTKNQVSECHSMDWEHRWHRIALSLQGQELVERMVESWELNSGLWDKQIELVNVEDSPVSTTYTYKATFVPMPATKRYIQVRKGQS